jgi:hypothetical protein
MENSSQNLEHIHLDDDISYCLFYIDGEEIRLASNFRTEEDMVEILNVVRNSDIALEIVCQSLSETEAAQLKSILNTLRNRKRPVISPLSMSRQK